MMEIGLEQLILQAPNFIGLLLLGYFQQRIIMRLLDKINECDCPSETQKAMDNSIANVTQVSKILSPD